MSFSRTLIRSLSRRMTLPQLSPTHSQGRIIRLEVQDGSNVAAYDPILIVECSADMITEAYREHPNDKLIMMIDTQEEGVIRDLKSFYINQWIPIGTELGVIDDGEPIDGEWTWQAYIDDAKYEQEDDKVQYKT